eukprot:g2418.t1
MGSLFSFSRRAAVKTPKGAAEWSLRTELKLDYREVTMKGLHEALDVWSSVLHRRPFLTVEDFDEVFGVMLGDAELHFAQFAGEDGARLLQNRHAEQQEGGDKATLVDARSVFCALTLMQEVALLSRLQFLCLVMLESNAADAGFSEELLRTLFLCANEGLCNLSQRDLVTVEMVEDAVFHLMLAAKQMGRSLVQRLDLVRWIEGEKRVSKFLRLCMDDVLGKALEEEEVAMDYLDTDLFKDAHERDEHERKQLEKRGLLWSTRVRSLLSSTSWRRRHHARPSWTCIEALVYMENHRLQYLPVVLEPHNAAEKDDENDGDGTPFYDIVCICDYVQLVAALIGLQEHMGRVSGISLIDDLVGDEGGAWTGGIRSSPSLIEAGRIWSKLTLMQLLPIVNEHHMPLNFNMRMSGMKSDMHEAYKLHSTKSKEYIGSECCPLVPVLIDQPLFSLLDIMAHPNVEHVPIVYSAMKPSKLISVIDQQRMLRVVLENAEAWLLGSQYATLEALGLVKGGLLLARSTDCAFDVFRLLVRERSCIAAAVLESDGLISCTITAQDLGRVLKRQDGARYMADVESLLQIAQEFNPCIRVDTIGHSTRFIQAIEGMVKNQVCHIFVCDDKGRPTGCLTASKVFELICALHEDDVMGSVEDHSNLKALLELQVEDREDSQV